ncbi:MAG: site-specific integrase [Longimicrobiales bacterium]|nr:site-specific integrase [Longimicrobiales bacterium]
MGKFHDRMDRELRIRGCADGTRLLYLSRVRRLVRHFMRPPDQLTLEDINEFQLHLTRTGELAWSTFNGYVCAIRFFYKEVLHLDWDIRHIPYQKTATQLPVVLSGGEICALLAATSNLKHRAIFMTLYGAGLRSAEARSLRVADIDSQRMVVRVVQGKRRKDRYVMLSKQLLASLREYWRETRPGSTLLFPGASPGCPLAPKSVARPLLRASRRAGITKEVHPHTLRHTFATHLLERGVNIRVIQRLLGHKSLRSTEIYTHVAGSYLQDTQSPLDDLLPVSACRQSERD